jgi:hypothetical protein
VQQRYDIDPARPFQLFLRPAIGVQLNPRTSLLFGYVFVDTYPERRPAFSEHRPWQQLTTRLAGTPNKAILNSRTRLEERFVVGSDDSALRLRQQFRGQVWLGKGWSAIATTELFFGFESTNWGQGAGLEQLRNFVGVGIPAAKGLTLEVGYLNQWLIRPGRDIDNNVLNLTLAYRFG